MPLFKKKYIPGLSVSRAFSQAYGENKKVSSDTLNRDYVVRTVVSYINKGISMEKALDKIMEDDIVKEFEYLTKNGLDMKKCFRDWVEREINKPRRRNERTR